VPVIGVIGAVYIRFIQIISALPYFTRVSGDKRAVFLQAGETVRYVTQENPFQNPRPRNKRIETLGAMCAPSLLKANSQFDFSMEAN